MKNLMMACFLIVIGMLVGTTALADKQPQRQTFQLPEMAALDLPFSDAVLVGDTLYISGTGGLDLSTMTVPDDPEEEAELLMQNIGKTLAMANMTFADLVSVTVYCPDLSLYSVFNNVYKKQFSGSYPARAFIGSGPLLFGMRFEIQAIAVRSKNIDESS